MLCLLYPDFSTSRNVKVVKMQTITRGFLARKQKARLEKIAAVQVNVYSSR